MQKFTINYGYKIQQKDEIMKKILMAKLLYTVSVIEVEDDEKISNDLLESKNPIMSWATPEMRGSIELQENVKSAKPMIICSDISGCFNEDGSIKEESFKEYLDSILREATDNQLYNFNKLVKEEHFSHETNS